MVEAANTLLAEVERLRDENASYRPIVEQVATLSPIVAWGSDFREICGCCYGHREASDIDQGIEEVDESAIIHAPGCPVLHARAILGREDEA
jgi:hydrogenase maturation factor